jgi:hypothetical protein
MQFESAHNAEEPCSEGQDSPTVVESAGCARPSSPQGFH